MSDDAGVSSESFDCARAVADAVLYEGYLLYPYRADSRKNHSRWQFGVLGPPTAAEKFLGEDPRLAAQFLLRPTGPNSHIIVYVRFLQLQRRSVERLNNGVYEEVAELVAGDQRYLSWDEAVAHDLAFETDCSSTPQVFTVSVDGSETATGSTIGDDDTGDGTSDEIAGARIRRTRWPIEATLSVHATSSAESGVTTVAVGLENTSAEPSGPDPKTDALRHSFLGAHLILTCSDAEFVSLLEPDSDATEAAAKCTQHRCFPVLAGAPGERRIVLVSPIILYDYPEIAGESTGPMFDATEIDEILTLRVMAMTDDEKVWARSTDPLAADIIDRADSSTAESLATLHGTLRDVPEFSEPRESKPWWDPAVDGSVDPETNSVLIDGFAVSKGSLVRVHPSRSADAQDLFFADQVARVTMVQADVDGGTHIGVVLVDDPAADLHDWFGRYLYFAPDELEPLNADGTPTQKESAR